MAFRVGGRGGGQRGGRPVANVEVLEAMQQMQARLEAMEMERDADVEDVIEPEVGAAEEEEHADVTLEMRFFKSVLRSTSKPRLEVSTNTRSLSPEELIDWINDIEKFFDYEETEERKRVKFVVTKLKRHAALWWDGVQAERRRLGKQPIKIWNRMVAKLNVKEYTEEFYKVSIRIGQIQNIDEKVARYVNGLRMEIQDGISVLSPKVVEEAYQMVLKAEEKLMKKKSARNRSTFRGRGNQGSRGRSTTPRDGASSSSSQHAPTRGDASGRGSFSRGRGGRGRGREVRCYRCNKMGHRAYKCQLNIAINQRNEIVAKIEEEAAKVIEEENVLEKGEYLIVNKVLLKPAKEIVEPA
eukprot:PITA_11013